MDGDQQYRANLAAIINDMDPQDKALSMVMLGMATIICELINRREWQTINDIERICLDLFQEASDIRNMPRMGLQ